MHKIDATFVPFFDSKDLGLCMLEQGNRFVPALGDKWWSTSFATPAGEYAMCSKLDVVLQWRKSTTINHYLYKVNSNGSLDHANYYYCTTVDGVVVWKHYSL